MDKIEARAEQENFRSLNGSVMRTINVLAKNISTYQNIRYAINADEKEFAKSVDYLLECGFIRRADSEKLTLTPTGTKLLCGFIEDELVEI